MNMSTHCPVHNAPWKTVPAGWSEKKQKSYQAFQCCPIQDCNERPPKGNGAAPQGSPQQAPKPSATQHPNAAADARLRAASAAWSAAMNWASGTSAEPLQIEVRAQAGYMFILRAYQGQPINSNYQPTRQPGEDDDIPFGDTAFHPELA